MSKKKKVRVDLRKNRNSKPRDRQWTRGFQEHGYTEEATTGQERVRAKGDLSRRRTILQETEAGALKGEIRPLLCLNKAGRVEVVDYQPLIGFYNQLGVPALLTSATTGLGVAELRAWLKGRQTVFSGQSGVGKSSLLNALEPEL